MAAACSGVRLGAAGVEEAVRTEALEGLDKPTVIVARRIDPFLPLGEKELDFAELLQKTTRRAEPVSLDANDPGFII